MPNNTHAASRPPAAAARGPVHAGGEAAAHARPAGEGQCRQAWHGGLTADVLRECRLEAGHRGWHRDQAGGLSWGGELTAAETVVAEALRADR